jgi:hypothetical protein
MRHRNPLATRFMIAALVAAAGTLGACAGHQGDVGSYYDPYYSDYHHWYGPELGLYGRWESETNRPHLDFGRRPEVERRAYYTWRHRR